MNDLKARVLIVDHEARVRERVRQDLASRGFDVTELGDGARTLATARTVRFDVIVLDTALPQHDGIRICRALRARGPNVDTPILMLAPGETEADRVAALESGADDSMARPFGIRELAARVSALLRRSQRGLQMSAGGTCVIQRGDVVMDVDKRLIIANRQRIELTRQEFDLLHLLLSRPGIVFSREALLAKIWGSDTNVTARTVDAVISRLRRKVEMNAHDPKVILTAWGVGYKCADTHAEPALFSQSRNSSVTCCRSESV